MAGHSRLARDRLATRAPHGHARTTWPRAIARGSIGLSTHAVMTPHHTNYAYKSLHANRTCKPLHTNLHTNGLPDRLAGPPSWPTRWGSKPLAGPPKICRTACRTGGGPLVRKAKSQPCELVKRKRDLQERRKSNKRTYDETGVDEIEDDDSLGVK